MADEPLTITLTAEDVDLLQDAVAECLANWLVRTPIDMHDDPRYRAKFDALVQLGRKLGMQL